MLRKYPIPLISLILILSLFLSGCITQQTTKNQELQSNTINLENSEKVIVTKIIDGDTVIVSGGETIRLLGMDTPEKGEPYYKEATNYLKQTILFQEVYLEKDIEDRDVYGRQLRWVWFNNTLIDLEQVKNGLAISRLYPSEKYQDLIKNAENLAINQGIGIWSRLNQNNTQNTPSNLSINTTLISNNSDLSDTSCISLGCPSGTLYAASKNSDKYHSCSCYNAKRIKSENLVCFSSKEQAEQKHVLASCG